MQIIDNYNFIAGPEGYGVCLGNFDGVHLGHCDLIRLLKDQCEKRNLKSMVYTFRKHPSAVISRTPVQVVMTEEQRLAAFENLGVDSVFLEDFTSEFAGLSPQKFVEDILVKKLNAKLIVVGYDYSFGKMGQGTPEDMVAMGKIYGFEVCILPPVTIEDEKVCSTALRGYLEKGEMENFRNFAGHPYSVWGTVIQGRHVGHQLGFPTANILPAEELMLPPFGVYVTYTEIDGQPVKYRSITNIGKNPTFHGDRPCTVETHIIDYNKELYGKKIHVYFIKQLRGEIKFSSPEALSERMKQDVETARKERINFDENQ